jgi:hypothetical protein
MESFGLPNTNKVVGTFMEDIEIPQPANSFELMLEELHKLNVKYLQQLLSDLRVYGYIRPWSGDYHRMLINSIESAILERTVLK